MSNVIETEDDDTDELILPGSGYSLGERTSIEYVPHFNVLTESQQFFDSKCKITILVPATLSLLFSLLLHATFLFLRG